MKAYSTKEGRGVALTGAEAKQMSNPEFVARVRAFAIAPPEFPRPLAPGSLIQVFTPLGAVVLEFRI